MDKHKEQETQIEMNHEFLSKVLRTRLTKDNISPEQIDVAFNRNFDLIKPISCFLESDRVAAVAQMKKEVHSPILSFPDFVGILFALGYDVKIAIVKNEEEKQVGKKEQDERLSTIIDKLNMSIWDLFGRNYISGCLERNGKLKYVGQLVKMPLAEVLEIPGIGKVSASKITGTLSAVGLSLDMNIGSWKAPQ